MANGYGNLENFLPAGDSATYNESPTSNTPNVSLKDSNSPDFVDKSIPETLDSINLKKTIYGHKKTKEYLNTEFTELSLKDFKIKNFFELYKSLFYDIPVKGMNSHEHIAQRGIEYIGEFIHPRSKDIDNLYNQIKSALESKLSIVEEHSIIKNFSVLQRKDTLNGNFLLDEFYYIQTYRKRLITNNDILENIRIQNGLNANYENPTYFAIPISQTALNLIPDGPPINNPIDLKASTLDINSFSADLSLTYLINTYGSPSPNTIPGTALPETTIVDRDMGNINY